MLNFVRRFPVYEVALKILTGLVSAT